MVEIFHDNFERAPVKLFIKVNSGTIMLTNSKGDLYRIDYHEDDDDRILSQPAKLHIPPRDEFEYEVTSGPRKSWDGLPDLSKSGWEEYKPQERFDYHEERYWRKLLNYEEEETQS